MQILITNDDGVNSKGIIALANKFKEMGDVLVVAPNKQMSATSHSITTNKPLRYKKHYINNELFGYALEGTPADCVKFAILELLKKQKPDILLSGINHGRNTGINIMYSGTVAGATEGALLNIPSFAVSLSSHDTQADCNAAADYAFQIVTETMAFHKQNHIFEDNVFLNINIPDIEPDKIQGIKVVKSSNSYWDDEFDKRIDPYGNPYYWFNGTYVYNSNDTLTDDVAIDDGYVSVTPVKLQFNINTLLEPLQPLELIGTTPENAEDQEMEAFQEVDAEIEKILESRAADEATVSTTNDNTSQPL